MEINWNEVVLLVIGAGIGFLVSILTMLAERLIDKRGKLNIFYRFTCKKGPNPLSWGFEENAGERISFVVPVMFEFQNTSNTTRVIRDVSVVLYNGDKQVINMPKLSRLQTKTRRANEIEEQNYYFGTEKGSYSFVLPPRSIQRQECEYMWTIRKDEVEANRFNRVEICYHDERNNLKSFNAKEIPDCWQNKHFEIDEDWILLK